MAITITSPNTNVNWIKGSTHAITWTSTAASLGPNIKIELLKAGVLNSLIIYSTPNDGSYSWTIPSTQTIGTDYKIRITACNGSPATGCSTPTTLVTDTSDVNFQISAPVSSLTVTIPATGTSWAKGTTQIIKWNYTGNPGNVSIHLYRGTTNTYITTISSGTSQGTGGSGSYSWAIPSTLISGTDYKLTVRSVSITDTAFDWSAVFTITGPTTSSITVGSPNGGESWQAGSTRDITWTSTASTLGPRVKIELYKGGVFNRQIAYDAPNTGSYSWAIPSDLAAGNDYKIKITACAGSSAGCSSPTVYITDESNSNFTISAPTPSITVTSPNGGEDWQIGGIYNITWSSVGSVGNVKIEIVKGGVTSTVIAANVSASPYSWTIPIGQVLGTDYKIRITSVTDANVNDISDSNFTISAVPTISVTSPNGGEIWKVGSVYNILWSSLGTIANVKIELMKGGVFNSTIVSSVSNTGSFSWTVPTGSALGNDYKIKISNAADTAISNISNGNFTIGPPAGTTIVLTAPNGGENWNAGESQTISWTSTGNPGNIKIELLKGNVVATVIAESIGNIGLFSWTIPSSLVTSNEYRVRITSIYDSNISDNSDNNFTINNLCPVPESEFAYSVDKLKVQFTDASTNNPTGWSWNFGDNVTSNEKNPIHTYAKEGTYVVVLTSTNDCGTGTAKSKTLTVSIPPPSHLLRNIAAIGFGVAVAYFGYNAFKKPKPVR